MKEILKAHLRSLYNLSSEWVHWKYSEDLNPDALSDAWLENGTSYIYAVGILAAIDANKCDWAYVTIGMQRTGHSDVDIIGTLHFRQGENDDMGRVLARAMRHLPYMHPAFEDN